MHLFNNPTSQISWPAFSYQFKIYISFSVIPNRDTSHDPSEQLGDDDDSYRATTLDTDVENHARQRDTHACICVKAFSIGMRCHHRLFAHIDTFSLATSDATTIRIKNSDEREKNVVYLICLFFLKILVTRERKIIEQQNVAIRSRRGENACDDYEDDERQHVCVCGCDVVWSKFGPFRHACMNTALFYK